VQLLALRHDTFLNLQQPHLNLLLNSMKQKHTVTGLRCLVEDDKERQVGHKHRTFAYRNLVIRLSS